MRFSLCTDALWPRLSCEEAAGLAARLGARAIEFWSWWDKDLPAIRAVCRQENLRVAAICTRFISLVDETQREAYLDGLKGTLDAAEQLGAGFIISQVGDAIPGLPREKQHGSLLKGLARAAALLEGRPLRLLIEPLNSVKDHKGYYLSSSSEAVEMLEQLGHPQVGLLFDLYHQAMMGENLLDSIISCLPHIGHMHCAGVPGRGPLRQGRLDYAALFSAIDGLGYQGLIGMEWMDKAPEEELAHWLAQERRPPGAQKQDSPNPGLLHR